LLAVSILVIGTACGDKSSKQAGGAPGREIQLAPSPPVQPQLTDTAVTAAAAAPKQSAPKPAQVTKARPKAPPPADEPQVIVRRLDTPDNPPAEAAPATAMPVAPPAPAVGTIEAGTSFLVKPLARVCTNTFKPGDRFTATLNESVRGSNGATIPVGSSVVLKVDESARSENTKDNVKLTFSTVSVRVGEQSYDLTGSARLTAPLEKVRVQSTGDQAKKIGAGAVIGAIAGQLLGKNTRSTVIGGAVGTAAGAAVAAGTADYDGCVPASAALAVSLDSPLRVKLLPN
jgi:hypothetical protein